MLRAPRLDDPPVRGMPGAKSDMQYFLALILSLTPIMGNSRKSAYQCFQRCEMYRECVGVVSCQQIDLIIRFVAERTAKFQEQQDIRRRQTSKFDPVRKSPWSLETRVAQNSVGISAVMLVVFYCRLEIHVTCHRAIMKI